MATRRLSKKRKKQISLRNRISRKFAPLLVIAGGLLFTFITFGSFLRGEPLRGKSSGSDQMASFRSYGEGAFAVDHVAYLPLAALGVIIIAAGVVYFLLVYGFVKDGAHKKLVVIGVALALALLFASGVIGLILLIGYGIQGLPFHNFEFSKYSTSGDIAYVVTGIMPLFAIVLSIGLAVHLFNRYLGKSYDLETSS